MVLAVSHNALQILVVLYSLPLILVTLLQELLILNGIVGTRLGSPEMVFSGGQALHYLGYEVPQFLHRRECVRFLLETLLLVLVYHHLFGSGQLSDDPFILKGLDVTDNRDLNSLKAFPLVDDSCIMCCNKPGLVDRPEQMLHPFGECRFTSLFATTEHEEREMRIRVM